jgi:Tol biopolymer transport system component
MLAPWMLLLATCCVGERPDAPLAWSPDGRWLAYVQRTPRDGSALRPGWLLDAPTPRDVPADQPGRYRLWAVDSRTNQPLLLDESDGAITSPAWGPDGTALAYGKLRQAEAGQARFEVIVQDGPDRRRVVYSRLHGLAGPELANVLGGAPVAWSPDGRYLAVPQAEPSGVAFLRADRGHLLKVVDGASGASWSPDGTRAAFARDESVFWIDTSFGEPRRLIDVPRAGRMPTPVWSRDSRSLLVVARGLVPRQAPRRMSGERVELVGIDVETGRLSLIHSILPQPNQRGGTLRHVSFALDPTGGQIFYTTVVDDQATQITWAFPRDRAVRTRFNPVDESVPLGVLALPPEPGRLAIRVGDPGASGLVGLCDPQGNDFTPLIPDDASRLAWIGVLVAAAGRALDEQPVKAPDGATLERITLLPSPGELNPQAPALPRLRHLGRLGQTFCELPGNSAPTDPSVTAVLAEARLFFAYLDHDLERPRESFRAALAAFDGLENDGDTTARRVHLLCIRLQIALGLGDRDQVLAAIAYLRRSMPQGVQAIEETLTGPRLTPVSDPLGAWLALLEREAQTPEPAGPLPEVVEIGNHDAPQPGLGLDLLPAPPPDRVDQPAIPRPPAPEAIPRRGPRFRRRMP